MQRVAIVVLAGLMHLSCAAASAPDCTIEDETFVSRDVVCNLPAAEAGRRFSFVANFSGGHDDTRASITTTLDDQPLACLEGSKTSLFGEDGDVSLTCRFAVQRGAARAARLKVLVRWSHAEYTDFQLRRD